MMKLHGGLVWSVIAHSLVWLIFGPSVHASERALMTGQAAQPTVDLTVNGEDEENTTRPSAVDVNEPSLDEEDVDITQLHNSLPQRRQVKRARPISKMTRSDLVLTATASNLGVPQIINAPGMDQAAIEAILADAEEYFEYTVKLDDRYLTVRDTCRNQHAQCAHWAAQGKCDDDGLINLWLECAVVCQTCEQLHYVARCPIDQNAKHAWYPGDGSRMFERILQEDEWKKNSVKVFSRPTYVEGDTAETADYQLGPWLILLEEFTTAEECQALIEVGDIVGREVSEDVGDELDNGEVTSVRSSGRTSTNSWCDYEHCESHPLVAPVLDRLERLTGINRTYAESLQLLKYEPGQFYEVHHDYIEGDYMRASGARVLTVYMYLNDVEEGGGTNFPHLGIEVKPKRGSVVLWPSVLDNEPHAKDDRTEHEALPVIKGVKYGANAWYHQRQVQTLYEMGC